MARQQDPGYPGGNGAQGAPGRGYPQQAWRGGPAPYQQFHPGMPAQGQAPVGSGGWNPGPPFRQQPPAGMRPPRKKRRLWLKLGLPLVLVVVLAGGFLLLAYDQAGGFRSAEQKDLGSGSVTDPLKYGVNIAAGATKQYSTDVPGYSPGAAPNAEQLAAVNPRQLYFAMLKRQGMAKLTELYRVNYRDAQTYASQWPVGSVEHSVVEWSTRKNIYETAEVDPDGSTSRSGVLSRCIDGNQEALFHPADPVFDMPAKWETQPEDDLHTCSDRMALNQEVGNVGTTDGVGPGGLSSADMDKYLSYLDHVPGLVDVRKPTLVSGKNGKRYIQLDARIVPQDAQVQDSDKQGVAFVEAAFAQTGKNPRDYPLIVGAGANQGRHFLYYIDPLTLLPAYAVALDTQVLKLDGTVDSGAQADPNRDLYQYKYPRQLDPARRKSGGPTDLGFTVPPFERPDLPD